ncbi:MAG: CrcB family protein [Paracoccus sp. (in: a-proteobacteria)]|nr:CrcB family protein [Paracoccus sp. (in: a-proteobacteria)]
MVNPWLQVALGGALGSVARYGVGRMLAWDGRGWPLHTLTVNVLGGLAIGMLAASLPARAEWQPALMVGLMGGFTTFSAFSLEVWQMLTRGQMMLAGAYVAASVLLSLGAVGLGLAAMRGLG